MVLPNRRSIRLKGYDYSSNGVYFITICTQNREHLFGNIINGKMETNPLGDLVVSTWESLSNRFPIIIDTFQIMPNHFHGLIIIDYADMVDVNEKHPTLGNIIAYFKYQSTKQINNIVGVGFSDPERLGRENPAPTVSKYPKIWQRNYYEHVIRNEGDLDKISQYIADNPRIWDRDGNNPNFVKK